MKSKDTDPELRLQHALNELNLAYRRHVRSLPGTPDIVFGELRLAVFVHGCYWHRHQACVGKRFPHVTSAIWAKRFNAVVKRDSEIESALKSLGWESMVVWECRIRANALREARRVEARLAKIASS